MVTEVPFAIGQKHTGQGVFSVPSYTFGKSLRLLTPANFKAVFDDAPLRASHQHFLVLSRPNNLDVARLGLVIAKKNVRRAVDRNRLKRVIRESFRLQQEHLAGLDVIVLARRDLGSLDNASFTAQLEKQWQRIIRKKQQGEKNRDEN